MSIQAEVLLDSLSHEGKRLTTMVLQYPRFVHSEFMTHRVFSRNASSSRAVPTLAAIERILTDPAAPVEWGAKATTMQSKKLLSSEMQEQAKVIWFGAMHAAVEQARSMYEVGAHKQVVNRLTEPFSHIQVLVSATDWDNFFRLRVHADADPTIQELAYKMLKAYLGSSPVPRKLHLPYIQAQDREYIHLLNTTSYEDADNFLKRISAARCARVSYGLNERGNTTPYPKMENKDIIAVFEKDLELAHRLAGSAPIHASPFEHIATACTGRHGNFDGWKQYRQEIESLVPRDTRSLEALLVDYETEMAHKPWVLNSKKY